MLCRIVIVVGITVVIVFGLGSVAVPGWAVVACALTLFLMGIAIGVNRVRAESRLMRTFWKALTGR